MANESINHPNAPERGHTEPGKKMHGRQPGHNAPREAFKPNQTQNDRQPGEGQRGNQNTSGARQRSGEADTH